MNPGIDLKRLTVWVEHDNVPSLVEKNYAIRLSNKEWMHGAPIYLQHGRCLTEVEEIVPVPEWVQERLAGFSSETLESVGFSSAKLKRKYVKKSPEEPDPEGQNGAPGDPEGQNGAPGNG